jgi:hypothetical protein
MTVLGIVLAGLSIGWLAGLSASPVVQGVLTAILGLAVSCVTLLAGLEPHLSTRKRSNDSPNAASTGRAAWLSAVRVGPIVALTMGLATGASIGVFARTHDWLGTRSQAGVDASKEELLLRSGVLFTAASPEECVSFRAAAARGSLREALAAATNPRVRAFAGKTNDASALQAALEEWVCASD